MRATFTYIKRGSVCSLVMDCESVEDAVIDFEVSHPNVEDYTVRVEKNGDEVEMVKEERSFKLSVALASVALVLFVVIISVCLAREGVFAWHW